MILRRRLRIRVRSILPLLVAIAALSPFGAWAAEGYFDYFYKEPHLNDARLARTFDIVLASAERGEYDRADEQVGDIVAKVDDLPPIAGAAILADAAIIKAAIGDAPTALSLLDQSIALVEHDRGPFDPLLFNMLMVEASIRAEHGEFAPAKEILRRAQHIVHRDDGVYTRRQLPIIDRLTRIDLQQGDPISADREQRFNLKISEQVYGDDSEELVPVLEKLGGYFSGRGADIPARALTRNCCGSYDAQVLRDKFPDQDSEFLMRYRHALFSESYDLYERSIKILEDKYGEKDPRLVEPLRAYAWARLIDQRPNKGAEVLMERAYNIVSENPATDISDRIKALVALGDLYNISFDRRARERYREAWQMLMDHPELTQLRHDIFGVPTRLFPPQQVLTLSRRPIATEDDDEIYADVVFTIDEDGGASDVEILENNLRNEDASALRRFMQRSVRFRPRIVDGKLVDTEGMFLHQTYKVLQPRPSEATTEVAAEDPDANPPESSK